MMFREKPSGSSKNVRGHKSPLPGNRHHQRGNAQIRQQRFLATRISFINEMAALCEAVGASIDSVSRGLAMDARTGRQIHAGIGYGGSCFPKDILALQYLAQTKGMETALLDSVAAVNSRQRLLPLARLRSRFAGTLAGVSVGVLGLAFKPGTSDLRAAPSLDLIEALIAECAEVRAFDPQANGTARQVLPAGVALVDSPESAARGAQALLLLTEWPEIVGADWAGMARLMRAPRYVSTAETRWMPKEW